MTIGERIKYLRKKNDLTQEKLADCLCVSYQAVSKWECGLTNPDLSLISPLTKLLHVSADELLGLNDDEQSARREKLEEEFRTSWYTGDISERLRISKESVNEFPGEMKYLGWLADCEMLLAFETLNEDERNEMFEKSVRNYETVIENTKEQSVLKSALSGIVISLVHLGQRDKAVQYAELYPENETNITKSDVMDTVLTGDEKVKNRQQQLIRDLDSLTFSLLQMDTIESLTALKTIIDAIITDKNYLYYYDILFASHIQLAVIYTDTAQYDDAVEMLVKARGYAQNFDKFRFSEPYEYRYTAPLLNLAVYSKKDIGRTGGSNMDSYRDWLDSCHFDALRDREDFKALMK